MKKKQRSWTWAIIFLIIIIVGTAIGVLWFLNEVGVWNFWTGLNVECSDSLCELRRME